MTSEPDPCNCTAVCPHGDRCLGGHSSPDSHWYPCLTCGPPDAHMYCLTDGRYVGVGAVCDHAVGPMESLGELSRALLAHRRSCIAAIVI